jgi:hypothetical protein
MNSIPTQRNSVNMGANCSAFKSYRNIMPRQNSMSSNRDEKLGRPAPLLRTNLNHGTSFFDEASTPQSTTALKRTLSIIAGNLGY